MIALFGIPAVVVWFCFDKRLLRKSIPGIDRGSTKRNLLILIGALLLYPAMIIVLGTIVWAFGLNGG